MTVYKQIAAKLCLDSVHKDIVCNPTHFILTHKEEDEPIDIAFVDEAHLLWTQGNQAYRGKNQLQTVRKLWKTWRQGSGYGIIKPSEPPRRMQAWGIFKEQIETR